MADHFGQLGDISSLNVGMDSGPEDWQALESLNAPAPAPAEDPAMLQQPQDPAAAQPLDGLGSQPVGANEDQADYEPFEVDVEDLPYISTTEEYISQKAEQAEVEEIEADQPAVDIDRAGKLQQVAQDVQQYDLSQDAAALLRDAARLHLSPEELLDAPDFIRKPRMTREDWTKVSNRYPSVSTLLADPFIMGAFGAPQDVQELGRVENAFSRIKESVQFAPLRNRMWRYAAREDWASADALQSEVDRLGSRSIPLPEEKEKAITELVKGTRQANKEIYGMESFYGPMASVYGFSDMPVAPNLGMSLAYADISNSLIEGGPTEFIAKATEVGVGMVDSVVQPKTLAAAGAGALIGAAEGGVGALPGIGYGLTAGVFEDNFELAYGREKMAARERGVPLDAASRLTLGVASLLLAGIETGQFKVATAPVKKPVGEAISSTSDLLATYIRDIASRAAYETGTEVFEEGLERLGVDVATIISNQLNDTDIDISSLDDYKNDFYEVIKFMLTGGAAVAGAGPSVSLPGDFMAMRQARRAELAAIEAGNQAVESTAKEVSAAAHNSEAMRTAPDAAGQIIERIAQDKDAPQTVFVDAEVLETYRQSAFENDGMDWAAFEDGFLEPMGITVEQYQSALDEGVSLELPLSGIPAVVDTPIWRELEQSQGVIRAEPGNITNERIELANTIDDPFADIALTAEVTEDTKVNLEQRFIDEAGRPKDQARAGAEILSRGVERILQPLGIDPNGWFNEKLSFSQVTGQQGNESLHQAAHIPANDSRVTFRDGMKELPEAAVSIVARPNETLSYDQAKKMAKEFSQQTVENADLGEQIRITNSGINETMRHRPSQADLKAFEVLPEILANAQWVRKDPNARESGRVAEVLFLYAPVEVDGQLYAAQITAKRGESGDLHYYGHSLKQVEGNPATWSSEAASGNLASGSAMDSLLEENSATWSGEAASGDATSGSAMSSPMNIRLIDLLENVKNKGSRLPLDMRSLYQAEGSNKPRGWLDIMADKGLRINFTEAADPTTMIHESGHLFVELVQQVLATDPGKVADWEAFGRLNEDFSNFAKWAGQDDPYGQWSTEAHEKAARGLETYLMEGKAPVPGLKRLFEQIKAWMIDVYRSLRNLDAPLTPEVRSFFDRLMASDMEITMDSWRTLEPEGLAPEIKAELDGPRQEARQAVEEAIRQKRVGEVEKMRRQWRKEGAEEANLDPHQQMLGDILQSGGISLDSLKAGGYSVADISALNRRRPGLVSSKSRVGFDEYAERFGYYGDSDSFIQALKNAPSRSQLIDQYAAQQESFYADYLSSSAPITEAEINLWMLEAEAVRLNDNVKEAARVLRETKAALKKEGGISRFKRAIHENTGLKLVDELMRKNMADLKASLKAQARAAISAAELAGREKGKAQGYKRGVVEGYKVGSRQGAAAKRLELGLKYRAEKEAKADIQKARARWKRFVNQNPASPTAIREGGVDTEFSIQAKQLLNQAGFNIRQRGLLEIEGAQNLAMFVAEQENLGSDIFAAEWILKGQWPVNPSGKPKTMGQLSYDEFLDLKNTVDSLLYVGRENQRLLAGENLQTFDEAAGVVIEGIQTNLPLLKPEGPGPQSKAGKMAGQFSDSLLKPEFIIREFDGPNTVMGSVWEVLFAPIKNAEDAEFSLGAKVVSALQEAWKDFSPQERHAMGTSPGRERLTKLGEKMWLPVPKSWRTTRYTFEGAPHSVTRAEMIAIAANIGNPDNLANLVQGNGFTMESLAAICDALTEKEWKAVDAMVKAINQLYEPLAETHYKSTGVQLPKVDPGEISLPNGVRRQGWYFPIVRDPSKSNMAYQQGRADTAANNLSSMGYGRRSARSGASHQRVGAIGALSLSLDVINKHVKDTTHDITHRLAVRDIQRILNRDDVRQAIVNRAGLGRYEQLQSWINWTAKPQPPQLEGFWSLVDWARRNTVTATLAFNVNTPIMQLMGFSQSVDFVGFQGISQGVRDLMFKPREISQFVRENSPSVAARDKGFDQDIQEILRGLDGDAGILALKREKLTKAAFWGIKVLDQVVVYATWWGAYDKAIKEGQTTTHAKEYADSAVRLTQPLASPKDTAAVQRDPKVKFLAMYYTFFSGFHNRLVERYRGFKGGQLSAKDLASTVIWTIIVPVMLTRMYQQEDIPDDMNDLKSLLWDVTAYTVSGVPLIRDLVTAAEGSYSYEISPLSQAGRSVSTTANKWGDVLSGEGEIDENLGKSTVRSAGYLFGLPSNQALRTWNGMWQLVEGDTSNPVRLFKPEPRE